MEKLHIRVFLCASKDDNEGAETLSEEGDKNERCTTKVVNLEEGIIDFPKIIVVLRSNEISGAVTDQSKIKAQRKRRLFEDL